MFRPDDTSAHPPGPGRLRRRAARLALPAVALLGLSLAGSPVAAETAEAAEEIPEAAAFEEYVAIGDSFTAGPLVVQQQAPLLGCMQSDANYPKMLAEQLGVGELVDVSCSGAVVEDLYEAQFDDQPPQLEALTPETDLVTIGIGGNDFGFADVLISVPSAVSPAPAATRVPITTATSSTSASRTCAVTSPECSTTSPSAARTPP